LNSSAASFDIYEYARKRNEASKIEGEIDYPSWSEKFLDQVVAKEILS
jgi:hypothetical protein